ncbi:MAG: hypothetical protein ACFB8W_16860 [Elainellaceae cyanobacterium]
MPLLANYNFILNHFYQYGAYLHDSGWFAAVMWRNGWEMTNPGAINDASYLNTHFAPIFWLTSAMSWLLPIGMVEFFALFQALAYGGFAVAVYWLLTTSFGLRGWWGGAIATLVAILFAFNGLIQDTVGYPHYEVAIASTLILFLCFWVQGRYRIATFWFVLCLIMREDAGFHVVAVLSLVVLWRWFQGQALKEQRRTLAYIGVGFFYSVMALVIQKQFFPSDSAFTRIYIGEPPFAHLTSSLLAERAEYYLTERFDLYWPLLAVAIWAWLARNPYLLIGYLAYVPWFLLNASAVSGAAGRLFTYYAYPFIISLFWPLVGCLLQRRRLRRGDRLFSITAFAVVAFSSLLGLMLSRGGKLSRMVRGYHPLPAAIELSHIHQVRELLARQPNVLGQVWVTPPVAAIAPRTVTAAQVLPALEDKDPSQYPAVDTIIYYEQSAGDEDARRLAQAAGLVYGYQVRDTPLRVWSNRSLGEERILPDSLVPIPLLPNPYP